jgi:hypothetical protein
LYDELASLFVSDPIVRKICIGKFSGHDRCRRTFLGKVSLQFPSE